MLRLGAADGQDRRSLTFDWRNRDHTQSSFHVQDIVKAISSSFSRINIRSIPRLLRCISKRSILIAPWPMTPITLHYLDSARTARSLRERTKVRLTHSSRTMSKRTWSQSNGASNNAENASLSPDGRRRPSEPAPSISRKVKACAACRKQKVWPNDLGEKTATSELTTSTDQMFDGRQWTSM